LNRIEMQSAGPLRARCGDWIFPVTRKNQEIQAEVTVAHYHMGDKTMYENDWSYFAHRLSTFLYGATVLI
jgi:hypothetical protein